MRKSLALEISASTNTNMMPGLFMIRALLPENGSPELVEQRIFDELERISRDGIPESTLDILKNRWTSWSIMADSDPSGMSGRFSTGWGKFRDHAFHWKSMERLMGIHSDSVSNAAERLLRPVNSTVAILRPGAKEGIGSSVTGIGKSESDLTPPAVQEPSEVDVPDSLLTVPEVSVADGCTQVELDNGLRLVMKPDRSFPVTAFGYSCPMGSLIEPPSLRGLAQVTAEVMLHGTREDGSVAFNARLENLGTSMDFSATAEYSGGIIQCLSRDMDQVLGVIADLLLKPAFRQEDLDTVKREASSSVAEWLETPTGAAMNSFSRLSTSPEEMASVPSIRTIEAIGRSDVVHFHRTACMPCGSVITAVGDVDTDKLTEIVRRRFAEWRNPESDPPGAVETSNSRESREEMVNLKGREQIAVIIGMPAPPRLHDDSYAFSMMNGILGDGIGSRLGRTVREAGLAYYVGSTYIPLSNRGRILTSVLTSPPALGKALSGLKREIERMVSQPVTADELRLETASRFGMQELSLMKYSSAARLLLSYASSGLPLDFDRMTMREYGKLTPDSILRSCNAWLGSGPVYTSIAGGLDGIEA